MGFRLNIGFLYLHSPGESMGSINRVKCLCSGLIKLNHKCYIFSPYNYYENWGPLVKFINITGILSKGQISKKIYQIIRKIINTQHISRFTLLQPNMLNFMIKKLANNFFQTIKESSYTLDFIIGEQEIASLILIYLKNSINIPIIANYHNYWPEELVEQAIIKKNSKIYNFLVNLEKKIIDHSNLVITNGEYISKFLIKQFGEKFKSKILSIPNGSYPILNKPKKKNFPPKIINSGMVVHRSNLNLFLESIPYIIEQFPESQFYITRKGDELKQVMRKAKKMKLNVNFYWKNSYQEFIDLLSNCNVGIVTSSYELTRQLGFASKILDYLAVGLPVVGNNIGGWTEIIPHYKIGILSKNEPKDLAKNILNLLNNQDICYEFGQNGINLLKNDYNSEKIAQKLVNILISIKNKNSRSTI